MGTSTIHHYEVSKKILLIDHEPGVTRLIRRALERAGKYLIREEHDDKLALNAARWFQPDLILVDTAGQDRRNTSAKSTATPRSKARQFFRSAIFARKAKWFRAEFCLATASSPHRFASKKFSSASTNSSSAKTDPLSLQLTQ